jgi:hypothetical protein
MTTKVIAVSPETPVQELAALLSSQGISAGGSRDGCIQHLRWHRCEGDLLFRTATHIERRTARKRSRWFDAFAREQDAAMDYIKPRGAVSETTHLAEIADPLETKARVRQR